MAERQRRQNKDVVCERIASRRPRIRSPSAQHAQAGGAARARYRSAARLPASLPSSSLHPPFSPKSSVDEQPWSLVLFLRTGLGYLPPFRTLAMLGL